jgi:hypothetical protein
LSVRLRPPAEPAAQQAAAAVVMDQQKVQQMFQEGLKKDKERTDR